MPRVNHSATPKRKKSIKLGTERQSRWMADKRELTERNRWAHPGRASGRALRPPQPQQLLALQRAEIASPKCPFMHRCTTEDRQRALPEWGGLYIRNGHAEPPGWTGSSHRREAEEKEDRYVCPSICKGTPHLGCPISWHNYSLQQPNDLRFKRLIDMRLHCLILQRGDTFVCLGHHPTVVCHVKWG